ncbi:hypothetical protein HPP92_022198 [Vanilla planifolia]|uniref:Translation initiation factor 3 N-terminal domain-containing protein n=1 Tax=Vanilla planifolia TaxID=51239 RepID=A0A835PN40_VANPL|nr:hypothetical protein HPP92_022198 [Vanilla planifolia]
MSLWHKLAGARVYGLICQYNRCCFIPGDIGSSSVGAIPMMQQFRVLEEPCGLRNTFFSFIQDRSFAAPAQFTSKPKPEEKSGVRINEAITEPEVRLVTDEGHRVVSIQEALYLARKLGLDLVEVQRKAKVEGAGANTFNPAVCKLMDYCKEKYKQDVKFKERVKDKASTALRSAEVKEVRFKAKTEVKDLKVKAESVKRLMERGYRVKCTAMPTGKEEEDLGGLLLNLLTLIEDISIVESGPHLDTRHAYVIVRHIKFAPKKGKKISKAVDVVSSALSARPNSAAVENNTSQDESPSETEEKWAVVEPGSESENSPEKDEISTKYDPTSSPKLNSHFIGAVKDWSGFRAKDDDKDVGIGKPTSSKFGGPAQSSFSHPKQGSNRTFLQEPAVVSQSRGETVPLTVESNRYAKGNNAMGTFHQVRPANRDDKFAGKLFTGNMGRLPEQARMNENEGLFHLNSRDRAAHLNNPGSPTSNGFLASNVPQQRFGVFGSTKPSSFLINDLMGDITKDGAGKLNSSAPTYGIYSSPKTDQNASPSPKFGTFISKKASPGNGNASEKK